MRSLLLFRAIVASTCLASAAFLLVHDMRSEALLHAIIGLLLIARSEMGV